MEKNKIKNERIKLVKLIAVVIITSVLLKTYILSRVHVSGPSMMPTLNNNDSALIEKILLLTKNFKRGEVIVFDSENSNHNIYIKRIIGIEGDEIEISNGNVYVNGVKLNEIYLEKSVSTKGGTFLHENEKIKVKKGHLFVLGDNREISNDSRYFGEIDIKTIKGRVIFKVFPLNRFGFC